MGTTDISRAAFEPRKHYAGVRMQQGRVIVDDDWNEGERIESEDRRRARVDIIGPAGSPDNGFRIDKAQITNSKIDFEIEDGTFYVGGLRLELGERQTYRAQSDWLQWPGNQQDAPTAERVDLVYLEAYQEPVSAVEDSELFEVALGGPDTSTRVRTMQRVHILEDVKDDCCYAWGQLIGELEGSFTEENELVSDAKLTVTFTPGGDPSDLCSPPVAGGYLGAENQAIRVQLVDENTLTWGFDNAAPLYRVQLDATRKIVTLLTDPKDQAHWPVSGQIVEILPWSAVLPNNEKVAEIQGELARVDASYNPDTGNLTLQNAIPEAGFDDWAHRSDKSDLEKPGVYYYMRVWDRGADRTSDTAISFTSGTPVTLGKTGLQVTITGSERRAGDYWIIAARPETPNQVVPWDLEEERSPHGVRRFYAPLALIHWRFTGGTFDEADVRDCRPTFRPLTRSKTCCTYTVGDGKISYGDFDSIEDALKHLPPAGGQICVLPGLHRANVLIDGGSRIQIVGCGERTRVEPRDGRLAEPIFTVVDSQGVVLEHMDLIAVGGTAVVLEGSEPDSLRGIEVRHNRIMAYENGIRVRQGVGVAIHHNKIVMLDREGAGVGIYMWADESVIEQNHITVVSAEETPDEADGTGDGSIDPRDPCLRLQDFYNQPGYLFDIFLNFFWDYVVAMFPSNPFQALGGVQIAGGSDRVRVLANRICGGAGNGITLGSDLDLSALSDVSDEGEPKESEHVVHSDGRAIRGYAVSVEGKPLSGVTLSFRNVSGEKVTSVVTGKNGYFQIVGVGGGDFLVSAPGYQVQSVDLVRERGLRADMPIGNVVVLAKAEKAEADLDVLSFIYALRIEGNEISHMGLSGIGVPYITQADIGQLVKLISQKPSAVSLLGLALLTGTIAGFAINVEIYRNHIFQCLQNVFGPWMQVVGTRRGMGGISLALCEDLKIHENCIEDNGRNHNVPVCGIFVSYADQIDVDQNRILNNGPLTPSAGFSLQAGMRGGVVVWLATAYPLVSPSLFGGGGVGETAGAVDEESVDEAVVGEGDADPFSSTALPMAVQTGSQPLKGRQAVRIHGNIIEQPVGQALIIQGLGPISVMQNQLHTDYASAAMIAGAVLVNNIGRALGVKPSKNVLAQIGAGLLNGDTLFNGNRTCLAFADRAIFSQLIITQDDLGFADNQSDVLAEQGLLINSLLYASTLRASNSRFKEPASLGKLGREQDGDLRQAKLSLLALTLFLNNTTCNQGNHCVMAFNVDPRNPEVDVGNLAITQPAEWCQAAKPMVKAFLVGLLQSAGWIGT